ncbi:hypothetical protein EMIT0347P_30671 [Pseudomonas sp. IT-347P]
MPGFCRVHAVVIDQLGRIGCRAVDPVTGVLGAAAATEAGRGEVLIGREAKAPGIGKHFRQQHRNVQRNDFGVDPLQACDQLTVELRGELAAEGLQRCTVDGGRQANIRQQPDHHVLGAGGLQGLHAVGQTIGGSVGLRQAENTTLQEVVTAPGNVIQRIRVSTETVGGQVTGAGAFTGGGLSRDRVENLVGAITADRPVVAIRLAIIGAHGGARRGCLIRCESEPSTQQLCGVQRAQFTAAIQIHRPRPVGVALSGAGRAASVGEGPGIIQAVAENNEIRIRIGCSIRLGAGQCEQAASQRYKQRLFDHEQVRLFIVVGERNDSTKNSRRFAIGRESFPGFISRSPGHIARSAQLSYCAGTYERDLPRVDHQQTSGSSHQGTRPLALARLNLLCRLCRICIALPSLPV